ncbi:DUF1905 domain-containing protein [Segetibacter sp. 3557_3]|uniref:YdeI/OmpD-associated family protein n=1 Tax=Segetibacter sp. 3557_3 TaxID=2547429 RepID=UPI00105914FC|nr:YdeI/OmpD-associated family protein [Segetibacter sp. 3557_3]TDH25674.1 DUF1905 domain-containing protein [Segetibacter sp. 3557_3]
MVHFTTVIKRFDKQGDKTGWTYINVTEDHAGKLLPGNKKGFRIKGRLDNYAFEGLSLIPMGGGNFILPLNATIRKAIGKTKGAMLNVMIELDTKQIAPPTELIECLEDEPAALDRFNGLAPSHRRYFINWINEAKTDVTRAKRIAASVNAMLKGWDYGTMIRSLRDDKTDLMEL